MAKKDRIAARDVVDPKAIKAVATLKREVKAAALIMNAMVKSSANAKKAFAPNDLEALVAAHKKHNTEVSKSTKAQKTALSAAEKLKKKTKEVTFEEERLKFQLQEKRKAIRNVLKAQQKQETATKSLIHVLQEEVKTEAAATEQNKKLLKIRKQVDASTAKGAKQVSLINKRIDKNNNLLNKQASAYGKQKRNIGNYQSALEGMPGAFGAMAQGAKTATMAMRTLAKVPLILVILGIVGAIKGLVSLFKSTDSGATKLEATMNGLKAAFQVVKGAILDIIEGTKARFQMFIKSWELLKAKISGNDEEVAKVKEEMRELAQVINDNKPFENLGQRALEAGRAVYDLTFQMDALNDRMISAISDQKLLELQMERYIKQSKNQNASDEERIRLLEKGMDTAKELFGMRRDFAEEEYNNLIRQTALEREVSEETVRFLIEADAKAVESARETNEEIGELWNEAGDERVEGLENLYVKMVEADIQYEKKTKELTSLLTGLQKKYYSAVEQAANDAAAAKERAATQAADAELQALESVQTREAEQRREAQELELADMSAHFEETQRLQKENADKLKEMNMESLREWTQFATQQASQLASSIFQYQQQELQAEQQMAIEKAQARGASEEEIAKIEKKYAKERQKMQVKQAIINGALAVVNTLATAPWPINLIMAAVVAASTAVQVATIKAQKFAKGTDDSGAKGQMAWVGDGGEPEFITHKDGSQYWSPDTDTLTYLPPHSTVTPLHKMQQDRAEIAGIRQRRTNGGKSDDGFNKLYGALSKQPKYEMNITEGGFHVTAKKGNTRFNYIDKRYRS